MLALEREIERPNWGQLYGKDPHKLRIQELWSPDRESTCALAGRHLWYRKRKEFPALALGSTEAPVKTKTTFAHELFRQKISRATRQARNILIHVPISVSLQRLFDLLDERGKDDHGAVDPTQHAFKTASTFVLNAEWKLGREIKSAPVVDSEGGIRVTWKSGNKQVKLVCPATSNAPIYIYESSPAGSIVHNQNLTFDMLADRLSWLLHGDQSEQPSD